MGIGIDDRSIGSTRPAISPRTPTLLCDQASRWNARRSASAAAGSSSRRTRCVLHMMMEYPHRACLINWDFPPVVLHCLRRANTATGRRCCGQQAPAVPNRHRRRTCCCPRGGGSGAAPPPRPPRRRGQEYRQRWRQRRRTSRQGICESPLPSSRVSSVRAFGRVDFAPAVRFDGWMDVSDRRPALAHSV